MKGLILAISFTSAVLVLAREPAIAQRGPGRSGGPAGPPPISERGQMQDRSNRPTRESGEAGSVNQHQKQSKMTVGSQLEENTHLATQLQGLLPPGTDLQLASSGFKNLGQFVAACHVSQNLGIPFDQLKAKMTGESPVSLGKAIKELRPEVEASSEVKKAEQQARREIKEAENLRKNETRKPETSEG
jgi:hypothetical protein